MIGIATGYEAKAEDRDTINSIKLTNFRNGLLDSKHHFKQLTHLKISMLRSR